jgi:cell division initiation protein
MSSELDVPLVPSAEQIRRRMFASVRRGFDPDQVRDYLQHIADQVEQLERGLREARLEADNARSETQGALDAATRRVDAAEHRVAELEAKPPQDVYQDVSARLAELLRAADEQSQKLLVEGRAEANRLIAEARVEADRVRGEAQVRAEQARSAGDEALRRARSEADRALAGLAERRTVLVTQLQEMQARLMGVAQDLESTVVDPGLDQGSIPTPPPAPPLTSTRAKPSSDASSSEEVEPWGEDDISDFDLPADLPSLDDVELEDGPRRDERR